jgi:hypothetical protein
MQQVQQVQTTTPSHHRYRYRLQSSPWQPAGLQQLRGPARRPVVPAPWRTLLNLVQAQTLPQTVLPVPLPLER